MKKLLIIGASGLLGNKIVEFAKVRYEVIPSHNTKPLHSNSIRLDITDDRQVSNLIKRLKPHTVIHTASETNVDRCELEKQRAWKINVEGTLNVAKACERVNAKLVYISTDYVFDGEKGYYREEDRPNPINHYGYTKLEGEKRVTSYLSNYLILRTSVLYGWHPWKRNFVTWVLSSLKQGREITVVDDHYNTPTLVDNLAEIIMEAVQNDLRGLYHASGSERINRYEFAKRIAELYGLDQSLIKPVKMRQLTVWVAKRPRDSSLNTDRMRKLLKTKMLNVTEGLNMMKKRVKHEGCNTSRRTWHKA
jgi:dTDP-4-dehydrorhamnose reductase